MLHALHIVMNDLRVEAQELKEIRQHLVPESNVSGEFFASGCENQSPIFFILQESLCVEFLDHVGNAGLRDGEALGDVHHARVTLGVDQLQNLFEVILNSRGGGTFGRPRGHWLENSASVKGGQLGLLFQAEVGMCKKISLG
jgi:hypothetical protein